MKIRQKLIIGACVLALFPVITTSLFLGWQASDVAKEVLEKEAKSRLISLRDIKKDQIEDYFKVISSQLLTMADNRMIIDGAVAFKHAFSLHPKQVSNSGLSIKDKLRALKTYYNKDFADEYSRRNGGRNLDKTPLYNQLDAQSISLQYEFIFKNPHPLGSKELLETPADNSKYARIHKIYHYHIRNFLKQFEYYDIFIVDPKTGDIVYSVFKELDYTTSLIDGPYAQSGIGQAFAQANKLKPGEYSLVDFAPYTPSYEDAASFIATPIFEGEKKLGILIFQMPIDRINNLMLHHKKWLEVGLGDSGETYLVNENYMMRSDSRFFIEDPDSFDVRKIIGIDQASLKNIKIKKTTIDLLKIKTIGVKKALQGNTGFDIFSGYRGNSVLSAYAPLNIAGVHWAIMSEIDKAEAFGPSIELENSIALTSVTIAVFVIVIAASVGILFANTIISPIVKLNMFIKNVESTNNLSLRATGYSSDEIGEIAVAINNLMTDIEYSKNNLLVTSENIEQSKQGLDHRVKYYGQFVQRLAGGDFTQRLEVSEGDDLALLGNTLNDMANQFSTMVGKTKQAGTAISNMTDHVYEVVRSQSSGAEHQSSSINFISSNLLEVKSSLLETLDKAQDLGEMAKLSQQESIQGTEAISASIEGIEFIRDKMESIASTIQSLSEKNQQISEITSVVTELAQQLKGLALNAAIEAAKAGTAGKGFAVVAVEVKRYAEESQRSTIQVQHILQDISEVINQAVEASKAGTAGVDEGVERVNRAGKCMNGLSNAILKTNLASIQIVAAVREESQSIEQTNIGMTEIKKSTEQLMTSIERTKQTANTLQELAHELDSSIERFKI